MKWLTPHRVSSVGGLLLVLGLSACGGSDGPTGPSTPPPTLPPPRVVLSDTGALSADDFVVVRPFTTTVNGAFDVTVDWTFAANDIDVTIARGSCDAIQFLLQFILHECNIAATTESTTAKPETLHVASAPAGTYTFILTNFGPGDESISYQVVLTPSATASESPSLLSLALPGKYATHAQKAAPVH